MWLSEHEFYVDGTMNKPLSLDKKNVPYRDLFARLDSKIGFYLFAYTKVNKTKASFVSALHVCVCGCVCLQTLLSQQDPKYKP